MKHSNKAIHAFIQKSTDLSGRQAKAAVDAMHRFVLERLVAGDEVHWHGLGKFHTVTRKTRKFSSPTVIRTNRGTEHTITEMPAHRLVCFKPGKIIKETIRAHDKANRRVDTGKSHV